MSIDYSLFEKLEQLFPGGASSAWFVYAALIFQINDRMDLIAQTWRYIASITHSTEEQLLKARKLREALLKASVLVGFPKGINACTTLRSAISTNTPNLLPLLDADQSLRSTLTSSTKTKRGLALFTRIYAQHTPRVLHNMSIASGGDLSEFAISAIYGDLMAEETHLDAAETGLLEFLACYATGGSVWAQAKGHMYGARNLGNGRAEILGAVALCDAVEGDLGVRVDRSPRENWEWLERVQEW